MKDEIRSAAEGASNVAPRSGGTPDRISNTASPIDGTTNQLNGAASLVSALEDAGVDVCFANPGTSEMHFVAALDQSASLRSVLCLAETVVTGAADGYARMTDKPGVTLLHTGPGLANGLSNLHNAKKALSPILNIIGDHATYHVEFDAPLTADIEALAQPVSSWVKTTREASEIANDAYTGLQAAATYPGRVASLVLPADTAWTAIEEPAQKTAPRAVYRQAGRSPSERTVESIATLLKSGEATALILTSTCLRQRGLAAASRIQQATGADFLAQTSNARLERGAGRVFIEPVPYAVDRAIQRLSAYRNIVPVCAKAPVAFFAYPDKPSTLSPDSAHIEFLAREDEDGELALEALVEALGAGDLEPQLEPAAVPDAPEHQTLDADSIGRLVARLLPDNAIVVDESISSGAAFPQLLRGAAPHDWLQICGGSIGDGFPLATGAAIACPQRPVIALQADGSGMYSLQALWTQAREKLDITTLILSNRAYAILKHELANVGAVAGQTARELMELNNPEIDWVALAAGMGVDGTRVTDTQQFEQSFKSAIKEPGPHLLELVMQAR